MNNIYDRKEYKQSRVAYALQGAVEYLISLLVTDAFLATLLSYIGLSDAMIGIISSMISFAFLFNLITILLMKYMKKVKRFVIICDSVSNLLFMTLYVIPFLPVSSNVKKIMVLVGILFAYFFKYLINSILYRWGNAYVDPKVRGEFSAVKEMISLIAGIIFTLIIGYIIDNFETVGNLEGSFLFIAIMMLILNMCNFLSLIHISGEKGKELTEKKEPVTLVIREVMSQKGFKNLLILSSVYEAARYITVGFLGTFKTKDLLISVGTIQIINMIANLLRFAISKPLGKFSDRTSFAKGYRVGLTLMAIAFAINMFTTENTWWLIVLYTIFYNCSFAGTNANQSNMLFSYVKQEHIIQAGAIRSAVAGIIGFGASLVGSKVLAFVQANDNRIFGVHIYGQQILSAFSFMITLGLIIFMRQVVEKQERMIQ